MRHACWYCSSVNMTYKTDKNEATKFFKSRIWTHALSQEQELESSTLDRSAILTLYKEKKHLLFKFFISHIDFLYSFAHFEPNVNIVHISYAPWCRINLIFLLFVSWLNESVFKWQLSYFWLHGCSYYYAETCKYEFLKWGIVDDVLRQ